MAVTLGFLGVTARFLHHCQMDILINRLPHKTKPNLVISGSVVGISESPGLFVVNGYWREKLFFSVDDLRNDKRELR